MDAGKQERDNTYYSQYNPKIYAHSILKFSNTPVGVHLNSRIVFSLLKVKDFIIFFYRELIGAFFPKQSPIKAIHLAIQYGINNGKFLFYCLQIMASSSLKVG